VLRAPPISWLTICPLGQPEKAIGFEPQIELWLALYNRTACRIRNRKRRHDSNMNLRKKKTPRASQHCMGWRAGHKSVLLPVAGEVFLLTLPFIERRNRKLAARRPFERSIQDRFRQAVERLQNAYCCRDPEKKSENSGDKRGGAHSTFTEDRAHYRRGNKKPTNVKNRVSSSPGISCVVSMQPDHITPVRNDIQRTRQKRQKEWDASPFWKLKSK
jgi:hypothetical protein